MSKLASSRKLLEWMTMRKAAADETVRRVTINDSIKGGQSQVHEVIYGEARNDYPQVQLALVCSEKEAIIVTRLGEVCQGKCTVFVNNISEKEAPYTLTVTIRHSAESQLSASTPC